MNKEKELDEFADKMTSLTEDLPDEIYNAESQEDYDKIIEKYKQKSRENLSYEELIKNAMVNALHVAHESVKSKLFHKKLKSAILGLFEDLEKGSDKKDED